MSLYTDGFEECVGSPLKFTYQTRNAILALEPKGSSSSAHHHDTLQQDFN